MSRQNDQSTRTRRADSLRKLTQQHVREPPRGPLLNRVVSAGSVGQVTMGVLVQQIVKYLMQIIEALLQEENSENYRAFLATTEAMNRQLQRKMLNTVAQRCNQVRCEFIDKLEQLDRHARPPKPPKNVLQQERKKITQNILMRASSFNSFSHHRSHDLKQFGSQRELPLVEEGEGEVGETAEVGSIELNSIQSKLSALEEVQNGRMKQALEKLERKFQENCRDIKLLTQKHVEFKLNFEEKLELSLESLWNVTSDNQSKLCEIERHLHLA